MNPESIIHADLFLSFLSVLNRIGIIRMGVINRIAGESSSSIASELKDGMEMNRTKTSMIMAIPLIPMGINEIQII